MGLSQAMFSAISGLTNHQMRMDNIGNNLANVNTVGYKQGIHQFATLFSQQLRGGTAAGNNRGGINPLAVGLGTNTSSVNHDFGQGSLETTGNQRDMAIEGNGFFILDTGIEGDVWGQAYTRDGTFYLSSEGKLLGGEGMHVLGYSTDEDNYIDKAAGIGQLSIPIGKTGAARETTQIAMTGNLNSTVAVSTANVITSITVPPLPALAAVTDPTWITDNSRAIRAGHVETSAALWDFTAATEATATTNLSDLQYLKGTNLVRPFSGVTTGDTIEISFEKGGRNMSATFTYGIYPAGDGTTLEDLSIFLTGDLGDDGTAADTSRLLSGAMGTARVAESTSGTLTIPEEQAGAYMRYYNALQSGAVDYDGDAALDPTARLSIASNTGIENAITNIEFSFNNVNYNDMFSADSEYGTVTGGSTVTTMVVYDSLGNQKTVNMVMALVARDTNFSTWRWIAESTDDTDATWLQNAFNDSTNPQTSINVGTGTIRFDQYGRFVAGSEVSPTNGIEVDLDMQGVSEPLQIGIVNGLSSSIKQDLDFSNITQVAAANDFNLKSQDGTAPGTLDSFTVTGDGIINGVYSNGVVEVLGQLAIALVPNPLGLIEAGANLYIEGPASGEPQIEAAEVGGRGSIRAGKLELSNVDLSKEFTNLIVTQRGFQANARVITTSDEMLTELVNMKR